MMGQSSSDNLIPSNYKELKRLGAGSFGVVVKCKKKDTKETVALKIPHYGDLDNELVLMTFFKRNNLDKWNIVRFISPVKLTNNYTALAYESLDMTLHDYIIANTTSSTRLSVHKIRSVVQQLASALYALESIRVIHTDIKFDNIMLVDHKAQHLRVKLIDFGLAIPTHMAKKGLHCQVNRFRAPEIFLGLPFSESIDMWSLGVVMATLVLGRPIFPGIIDYYVMQKIVDLLGVPADHLLDAGMYTKEYFVKGPCSQWKLMTNQDCWWPQKKSDRRVGRINYPNSLETWPMEQLNMVEAAEREECIDLLKAMLRMDANERITPNQVLAHPFITRGNRRDRSGSIHEAWDQPPQIPYSTSMEYRNWWGSDSECHEPDAAEIPPDVILVQPAPPECRLALAEDDRQGETSCSIPAAPAPPPPTPSVSTESEYKSCLDYDSECHEPDAAEIPPDVILVQPAPPECCLALAEDDRQGETSCSIPAAPAPPPPTPSVSTESEYKSCLDYDSECHEPDAAEIPPDVILVQPAPPECCLALAEDDRQGETSCPLDLLEELSGNSLVELPAHSAEGPDTQQEDPESTPVPQKRKKRKEKKTEKTKKRKNPFKRLWAWAKETFTSSSSSSSSVDAGS